MKNRIPRAIRFLAEIGERRSLVDADSDRDFLCAAGLIGNAADWWREIGRNHPVRPCPGLLWRFTHER